MNNFIKWINKLNIKITNNFKSIFYSINKFIYLIKKGNSKYIIRLDDACETMDRDKWARIESILDRKNIKPIVAVIPNNQDDNLKINKEDKYFWNSVRNWQQKGWEIALHGYSHEYHKIKKSKQIIPLHNRSEFASLSIKSQEKKISEGIKIFNQKKIDPQIWVAPSHSFDNKTIIAIKNKSKIKLISDGLNLYPFSDSGMIYIPQQLWSLKKYPIGIWTVCLHPNNMSMLEINKFEKCLNDDFFKDKFINSKLALKYTRNNCLISTVYKLLFLTKIKLKDLLYRNLFSSIK